MPPELMRYVVNKGSLAVDGISLTVAEVEDNVVGFTIIPHTFHHTTLQTYRAGSLINVEVDILSKHIEKLMGQIIAIRDLR
jgi:riboflavin synthase